VGYHSHVSSRASLLENAQSNLLTATQVLGRNFQVTIDAVSGDARMLAQLPSALISLQRNEKAQKSSLAATFTALMAVRPEYSQVRLISASQHGLELVRIDRDGAQLTPVDEAFLQEKAHHHYVFKSLNLAFGEVNLSDIRLNDEQGAHSALGQPTVRVATPILASDGVVKGVIVISLDLNTVFDRLKLNLPSPYEAYLSNHWGDFLIHPDSSQTFGFETGRRILIQNEFPLVTELIAEEKVNAVASLEGIELGSGSLVSAFVRLPFGDLSPNRFVILGLARPVQDVVRATQQTGWKTVQLMGLLAALALVLASVVSRVVTGALKSMVTAVGNFSRSQTISVLPSKRQDEIGLLARSLNEMQTTIVNNLRQLKESQQSLEHLAQHDALTGLPNRTLFNDRLSRAVTQARRDRTPAALLFVDLDGFKAVNDRQGHHMGDWLLASVATRMLGCVREADTIGRIGGDEFVVLLASIEQAQDAVLVAEKIRATLKKPFEGEGLTLHISASIGVAIFPEHGDSDMSLSRSADKAMYQSKARGGDCVVIATSAC
jgi:diguanylate cyclase (GGDEF)-like protein